MSELKLSPRELLVYERYGKLNLPRHTSYPSSPHWQDTLSDEGLAHALGQDQYQQDSWSLYFHIPFCRSLCYYCGCTKEIRPNRDQASQMRIEDLLLGLEHELVRKAAMLNTRQVHHLHVGGGTPSYLNRSEWERLWSVISRHFEFTDTAEIAIELDPRSIVSDDLRQYRNLGFNRISLGVQDFDRRVQQAVNRLQSFDQVRLLTEQARELGFQSINFDLIYGLPFQTVDSIDATLRQVLALSPDRIAFYRLAVMPEIFKWQRNFMQSDLPQGRESLELKLRALDLLIDGGYEFIGLDHFAKPNDALAQAHREKTLFRNFQGMSSGQDRRVLGFGPSAISSLDKMYWQNPRDFHGWYQAQARQSDNAVRACFLNTGDLLRKCIIEQIYCYGEADLGSLVGKHAQSHFLRQYLAQDLDRAQVLIEDGLIQYENGKIQEKGLLGRLLRRVTASAFDAYLPAEIFQSGLERSQASQVG